MQRQRIRQIFTPQEILRKRQSRFKIFVVHDSPLITSANIFQCILFRRYSDLKSQNYTSVATFLKEKIFEIFSVLKQTKHKKEEKPNLNEKCDDDESKEGEDEDEVRVEGEPAPIHVIERGKTCRMPLAATIYEFLFYSVTCPSLVPNNRLRRG
uniref:Uncharacterized protein n=1 Tax=Glossina austeni TaxID=7395 RepID=A0A1A9V083_GLOAU